MKINGKLKLDNENKKALRKSKNKGKRVKIIAEPTKREKQILNGEIPEDYVSIKNTPFAIINRISKRAKMAKINEEYNRQIALEQEQKNNEIKNKNSNIGEMTKNKNIEKIEKEEKEKKEENLKEDKIEKIKENEGKNIYSENFKDKKIQNERIRDKIIEKNNTGNIENNKKKIENYKIENNNRFGNRNRIEENNIIENKNNIIEINYGTEKENEKYNYRNKNSIFEKCTTEENKDIENSNTYNKNGIRYKKPFLKEKINSNINNENQTKKQIMMDTISIEEEKKDKKDKIGDAFQKRFFRFKKIRHNLVRDEANKTEIGNRTERNNINYTNERIELGNRTERNELKNGNEKNELGDRTDRTERLKYNNYISKNNIKIDSLNKNNNNIEKFKKDEENKNDNIVNNTITNNNNRMIIMNRRNSRNLNIGKEFKINEIKKDDNDNNKKLLSLNDNNLYNKYNKKNEANVNKSPEINTETEKFNNNDNNNNISNIDNNIKRKFLWKNGEKNNNIENNNIIYNNRKEEENENNINYEKMEYPRSKRYERHIKTEILNKTDDNNIRNKNKYIYNIKTNDINTTKMEIKGRNKKNNIIKNKNNTAYNDKTNIRNDKKERMTEPLKNNDKDDLFIKSYRRRYQSINNEKKEENEKNKIKDRSFNINSNNEIFSFKNKQAFKIKEKIMENPSFRSLDNNTRTFDFRKIRINNNKNKENDNRTNDYNDNSQSYINKIGKRKYENIRINNLKYFERSLDSIDNSNNNINYNDNNETNISLFEKKERKRNKFKRHLFNFNSKIDLDKDHNKSSDGYMIKGRKF